MSCTGKRITRIGDKHVVVAINDLRDFLWRMGCCETDGNYDRCGDLAVFKTRHWQQLIEEVCEASRTARAAIAAGEQVTAAAARGGGGCQDFCDNACEGDGGCKDAGGDPGDCVAVCDNFEVYIELQV